MKAKAKKEKYVFDVCTKYGNLETLNKFLREDENNCKELTPTKSVKMNVDNSLKSVALLIGFDPFL